MTRKLVIDVARALIHSKSMSNTEIGHTIWQQIPTMTLMACGARKRRYQVRDGGDGLQMQVGGKPMRYVEVTLDPSDTYNVRYFRLKRTDYSVIEIESHTGIYADQLGEVIYRAVNK